MYQDNRDEVREAARSVLLEAEVVHEINRVLYRLPGTGGMQFPVVSAVMLGTRVGTITDWLTGYGERVQGLYDDLSAAQAERDQLRADVAAVRRVFGGDK